MENNNKKEVPTWIVVVYFTVAFAVLFWGYWFIVSTTVLNPSVRFVIAMLVMAYTIKIGRKILLKEE